MVGFNKVWENAKFFLTKKASFFCKLIKWSPVSLTFCRSLILLICYLVCTLAKSVWSIINYYPNAQHVPFQPLLYVVSNDLFTSLFHFSCTTNDMEWNPFLTIQFKTKFSGRALFEPAFEFLSLHFGSTNKHPKTITFHDIIC